MQNLNMTAPVLPRNSETIFDEESHTTTTRDNDVAQQEITQQLHRLNEQVSSAAALQSLVAVTLADMQDQLAHLGMLRAWEFCEGRLGSIPACAALNASAEVNHVVSEMIHPTPASETPTCDDGDQTNNMFLVFLLLTISIPLFAVLYQRLKRRFSDLAIYEPSPSNTEYHKITQHNGPAHGLYALVCEGQ
jgi:hypothetical protein